MSGGSEQTTESSTTETRDPWAPAAQPIQDQVLPMVSQWGETPQQYTGPSYVGQTPLQQQALQQQQNFFGNQAQTGIVDPTMQAWRGSLDPMNRLNAPGAMNPLNMYASEVGRTLDENIRPGYAQAGMDAGHYGGYSSERAQQDLLAQRGANESISKYGAGLFSDLYSQGLQQQQNALQMAPGMFDFAQQPNQGLYALGANERGELQQQQAMGNARSQFEQTEPLRRAQTMFGLLGPAAQLGGTSIGTMNSTTQQQQDPFSQVLGAGMMGASLFGGPAAAAAGPAMMGVGGMSTMPGAYGGGYQPFQWQGGRKYF